MKGDDDGDSDSDSDTLGVRNDHKTVIWLTKLVIWSLYGHFERLMVMLIFIWSLYNK